MPVEVVNSQGFCKAIFKYVGIADSFNHKLAINNLFSDIMILNINVFGPSLTLGILGEDNIGLIISI